jgi:hypothetical protein
MDTRLVIASIALFLIAYVQSSPLFFAFGIKLDVVLALAVLVALSYETVSEYAVLIIAGALGLTFGIGFPQALLFFSAIFILTRGVREMAPLRPFLFGSVLVIFFSFLTYTSLDWGIAASLVSQAFREALCNVIVFATLYAFLPPRYVRKGRY